MITPRQLTAIYSFSSATGIPISEVSKYVENYQQKQERKQETHSKVITKTLGEVRHKEEIHEIDDTEYFDLPKSIKQSFEATKGVRL